MFTSFPLLYAVLCKKRRVLSLFFFFFLRTIQRRHRPSTRRFHQPQPQYIYIERGKSKVRDKERGEGVVVGQHLQQSSNSSSIINYRLVPPSAHQEPGEMEWMQEATIAHPLGARLPLGVHQSVSAGRRFDLAEGEKECRNQRESCTRLCPPPSPHLIYKRINSPIEN